MAFGHEPLTMTLAQPKSAKPTEDTLAAGNKPRLLGVLGPGLITGASDDDPSGIATYSQAGAQFGFTMSWTMLLHLSLDGGDAGDQRAVSAARPATASPATCGKHYPAWQLQALVILLCVANTINIGADLGAMGDAVAC